MPVPLVGNVAKKKRSKPAPESEPDEPGRKPMIVQVRGSAAYKEWVDELAHFDGLPLAALVDRALRRYAKEIGFHEEPPRR